MVLARRSAFAWVVVIGLTGTAVVFGATGRNLFSAADPAEQARTLRLYYSAPMLVRPGERVAIPVDVVCDTEDGQPCEAEVEVGSQLGKEPWRSARTSAVGPLLIDLGGPAGEAAPTGAVRFFLRATDGAGKALALGEAQRGASLSFYVADRMPEVPMPAIPFGDVRAGDPVLSLPWGSGPRRAGLELGNESETIGPSSFDVGSDGRIYLLDGLQQRLAVFADGSLTLEAGLPAGPHLDVAATTDGTTYVASGSDPEVVVYRIGSSGSVDRPASLGQPLAVHLAVSDDEAFADLLPLDGWVGVPPPGESLPPSPQLRMGRPMGGEGELVRVVRGDSVRLAMVSGDEVTSAVEVTSSVPLGEVELAEPDGAGGYWVVVRVWQEVPVRADQYQVVHVRGEAILDSFAVASGSFASIPPLNRFRLAGGFLYQMTSSPDAVRIVRYRLGGES